MTRRERRREACATAALAVATITLAYVAISIALDRGDYGPGLWICLALLAVHVVILSRSLDTLEQLNGTADVTTPPRGEWR